MATQRNGDWSIGELVSELTRNLSVIIRGEIALLKLEMRNAIAQIGLVVGMLVVAGLIAFCGYIFFLMMLHSLFVQLLGEWMGELVVMAILFLTAGAIAWVAMRKLDRWKTSGVPVGDSPSPANLPVQSGAKAKSEEYGDGVN